MKLQLTIFLALFAFVYTSPLPQAVEEAVPTVQSSTSTLATTDAETVVAEEKTSVSLTTEAAENESSTDTVPATTELVAEPVPEENTAVLDDEEKVADDTKTTENLETVPEVQAGLAEETVSISKDAAVAPVDEVKVEPAQATADKVLVDAVQISDAVEPAAVASDDAARAVRTTDEEESSKTDAPATTEAAAVVVSEEKPVEQPEAKSALVEENVETKAVPEDLTTVGSRVESNADAAAPTTEAAKTDATTTTAGVTSDVTTQTKQDSSEESKESQESDEGKS